MDDGSPRFGIAGKVVRQSSQYGSVTCPGSKDAETPESHSCNGQRTRPEPAWPPRVGEYLGRYPAVAAAAAAGGNMLWAEPGVGRDGMSSRIDS